MKDQWIPVEKIQYLIQLESFVIFWTLLVFSFLLYKLILKQITIKRHTTLRQRFWHTFIYLSVTTFLALSHWVIFENAYHSNNEYFLVKTASYLSLFSLGLGAISIIKLSQIFVYIYLFFMNMSVGVPRLIANMFTLIFSIIIISWLAADVFGFQLSAVLATSAVFSLVLGLALQDTLGNLFSGVSLQIDSPFQIGDWIEIQNGNEKFTGQVQEISWRATTLMGFADEFILIPNRSIAQGQLVNYTHSQKPARLNQIFRFKFDVSIEKARLALMEGIQNIPQILNDPPPLTLVTEMSESWITIKIIYSLKDYETRYLTGDQVISQVLERIRFHKLSIAGPTLHLLSDVAQIEK